MKFKHMKKLIKFTKKIRTTYINSKKLSEFLKEIERYQGKFTLKLINPSDASQEYKTELGPNVRVIDIRDSTYFKSTKTSNNPEQYFDPEILEQKLSEKQIEYIRWKELSNPKELRKKYKINFKNLTRDGLITLEKAKEEYLKQLPQEDLKGLYKIINTSKSINLFFCYCNPPKKTNSFYKYLAHNYCHRFWLKQALINLKRQEKNFKPEYNCNYLIQEEILTK
jgi:hypothetical protein